MSWFLIAILSYLFLAIVSLFDRYLLVGPIPNPKNYTFYVGILWPIIGLFIFPFGIIFPEGNLILLGLIAGLMRIFAVLFLVKSITQSEVSRVVPAIGGFLPIFTFLLFFFYLPKTEILNWSQILAFILLVLGSVIISIKETSFKSLKLRQFKNPVIAAFLFALSFFLMKILYLKTDFLSGSYLVLLGGGIGAFIILILPWIKSESLSQATATKKTPLLFLFGQVFGGLGVFLQFYAISLAKASQVPIINALEGIRYVFLLFFIYLLSIWNPNLLKEEMKGTTLFQKIFAILLIGAGLIILSIY